MERDASVRRGAIAIGAAKAWFLVAGLAQNVLLPWAIGQGGFGAYKRALAFVNVLNGVVVVASIQAVSRAVARARPCDRRATLRSSALLHAGIAVALGLVLLALVPAIVAHQRAPHLAPLLRVLALVVVAYGLYAPLVGALNGVRAFGAQAGLDAGYAFLRTMLLVVGGLVAVRFSASDGALGAATGFAIAAVVIVPIAALATRKVRDEEGSEGAPFSTREHLAFLASALGIQLSLALVLQVDLMVLGRAVTLRAIEEGQTEIAARALADAVSGLYAQAQAFGLVPYQLLLAATYVLFPRVASAHARGDASSAREDVARGGSATLIVAGAMVAAIGGTPIAVLRFAFGRGGAIAIETGGPILRALTLGHAATAIAALGTTLLAAAGHPRLGAAMATLVCGTAVAGAAIGGNFPGASGSLGLSVAIGLAMGIACGAAIVALAVRKTLGPYVKLVPLARVVAASAVALGVGARLPVPGSRLVAPLVALVPLALYLVALFVLGESPAALLGMRTTRNARPAA